MEVDTLVGVRWRDAHGGGDVDLSNLEESHAPVMVTTFGLLLRDDDRGVSVANERVSSGWRGHTFIPRPLVESVWVVSKRPMRGAKGGQKNTVGGNSERSGAGVPSDSADGAPSGGATDGPRSGGARGV